MRATILVIAFTTFVSCSEKEVRRIADLPSPGGQLVARWYAEGGNSLAAADFVVEIAAANTGSKPTEACVAWRSYRAGPQSIEWKGDRELRVMLKLSEDWQQVPVQQQDCFGVKLSVELLTPPPWKEVIAK